jgi:hypothetical protein
LRNLRIPHETHLFLVQEAFDVVQSNFDASAVIENVFRVFVVDWEALDQQVVGILLVVELKLEAEPRKVLLLAAVE